MKYIKHIRGHIPHINTQTIDIPLNGRNLIITGRNGAGKTSLLKTLSVYFHNIIEKQTIENYEISIDSNYNTNKLLESLKNNLTIIRSFNAQRLSYIMEADETHNFTIDNNISIIDKESNSSAIDYLEYHLLNLKINSAFYATSKNSDYFKKHEVIENWFNKFDEALRFLFEDKNANLKFDIEEKRFSIFYKNKYFKLQDLSSGFDAILNIYSDILIRSDKFKIPPNELNGIVFIDELDVHLHLSLQKLVLPFLIKSFPNIQFIISTHSPFVITSTDNDTVVYDISSGEFFEDDLSLYSHESIIKELFHVEPTSKESHNLSKLIIKFVENDIHKDNLHEIQTILEKMEMELPKLSIESQLQYIVAKNKLEKITQEGSK